MTSRRGSKKVQRGIDDDSAQTEPARNRRTSRRIKQRIPYEENYFEDEEMALDGEWAPLVKIEGSLENGMELSPAGEAADFRYSIGPDLVNFLGAYLYP